MFLAINYSLYITAIAETFFMTLTSSLISYLIGIPLGVLLYSTAKDGLTPNVGVYNILSLIVNVFRSIPFLILLILVLPVTKAIVGTTIGAKAVIPPLVISASPYIARMVESSLKEVDEGVIEAAKAMGASNTQIVFKVLLVEARTSLITNATIALGTVLGYSAMAGTVGGGGLGDIAVRYGYYRYQTDIMIVTVILLIVLFQIFQNTGMFIARKMNHKI